MQANEFRIGNLVDLPITGIEPIHTIEEDSVNYVGLPYIQLVPLTEEWLKKFGFKEFAFDGKYWNIEAPFDVDIIKEDEFFYLGESQEMGWDKASIPLKHVHQLQNIYFALTGKELEIKQPATS